LKWCGPVAKPKDSTTSLQSSLSPLENRVTDESAGWLASLHKGWETEPFTNTWQHSLLTAFAAVVCSLLVKLLPLRKGYWAAISTVVCFRQSASLYPVTMQ
jgi:hypothetical protein